MDATTYTTPSFWSADGRLWWRGSTERRAPRPAPISRDTACDLRDFYAECAVAAWRFGGDWRTPAKLWLQIGMALDDHDQSLRRAP